MRPTDDHMSRPGPIFSKFLLRVRDNASVHIPSAHDMQVLRR